MEICLWLSGSECLGFPVKNGAVCVMRQRLIPFHLHFLSFLAPVLLWFSFFFFISYSFVLSFFVFFLSFFLPPSFPPIGYSYKLVFKTLLLCWVLSSLTTDCLNQFTAGPATDSLAKTATPNYLWHYRQNWIANEYVCTHYSWTGLPQSPCSAPVHRCTFKDLVQIHRPHVVGSFVGEYDLLCWHKTMWNTCVVVYPTWSAG